MTQVHFFSFFLKCLNPWFHIYQIRLLAVSLFLIPATVRLTLRERTAAGQSLVLPLKVREEEMEVQSVLVRALLHQRYEESFHLVSCESERIEGWEEGERNRG